MKVEVRPIRVSLPYELGTVVYIVKTPDLVVRGRVFRFQLSHKGIFIVCKHGVYHTSKIGDIVFFSRAEALQRAEQLKLARDSGTKAELSSKFELSEQLLSDDEREERIEERNSTFCLSLD